MPKKFHCSSCGIELTHTRKAVKGHIFELINPHECEGFTVKEKGDNQTVLEILDSLKPISPIQSETKPERRGFFPKPGDRRNDKSNITSSAPENLLSRVRGMDPSDSSEMEG
uniref:Uncharacterized protein n=1 Tax=viral metagenome TaxID=1070528 RepID=A0A6H1ZT67_9ZZZZ